MLSTLVAAGSTMVALDNHDGPGDWWPIFPIFWLLIFLTVAFFASRRTRHCGTRSGVSRLAERYAAGDIDETEYRTRLSVLKATR